MEKYTIQFKKVEEEDVSVIIAFVSVDGCSFEDDGLYKRSIPSLRWVMNHCTIPGMLNIAGSLERMIEVEFYNFYAEHFGIICTMYLQVNDWPAIERMQLTIENFIRHTIYKLGLEAQ